MTAPLVITIGATTACVILGAAAFKEFTVTRQAIWLVAGVAAYNFSNVGWIILIDHAGLARATAYCSAAQIISLTMIGFWRGETVAFAGWLAAILVCLAVLVASFGGAADAPTSTSSESNAAAADTARSLDPSHMGDQN